MCEPEGLSGRLAVAVCLVSLLFVPLPAAASEKDPKVLVLGIDGLDPKLIEQYVGEGVLPNFAELIARGDFKPLQTSMPPLSPIAWSNFITGMDAGGHGIFDFIHRDLETMFPVEAMAEAEKGVVLELGDTCLPMWGGKSVNKRQGTAFWQILDEHGVKNRIFRVPANFPPVPTGRMFSHSTSKAFSGMGTPDILGTAGTFSYFAEGAAPRKSYSGGKFFPVGVADGRVEAELNGPKNPLLCEKERLTVPFEVYLDPERPVARFVVQGEEFVLQEGEWSEWVPVTFSAAPLLAEVSAIGRFYLKQVRPEFQLYVTPLQINPENPAMPISEPAGWAHELWERLGYFYTQELPEDTKAFTNGVFTAFEFWTQAQSVYHERRKALDYFLDEFDEGLLFFYFSSVDQQSHMLWHFMDPEHPGFQVDEFLANGIRMIYRELDEALGHVVESIDDETTLIVMSDHGFGPFNRGVNLNTWLLEKGYAKLKNPAIQGKYDGLVNVDWSRTRAYALGLNGLYVNLEGREKQGIVKPEEYQALLDELERELLALKDPEKDRNAVTLVVQTDRDFHGPHKGDGPDIIVGYGEGYRSSWESPLGRFPKVLFVDNDKAWSGDHSVDYRLVPGTLISNRKITLEQPALYDLTVAILDEYGISKPEQMIGSDCLGERIEGQAEGAPAVKSGRAAP